MLEATAQSGITVQCRQLAQQLPGSDEQHRVALNQGLMAQIASQKNVVIKKKGSGLSFHDAHRKSTR